MMKMEFTFDEAAVLRRGFTMERVYIAVKKEFAKRELPCIADGDSLIFSGAGGKNDLARMLGMMRIYSKTEWFMDTAATWRFTTNERLGWEDVLSQAKARNEKEGLPWAKMATI